MSKIWDNSKNNPWRPRIFKTPKELWEKAVEYFDWCDQHPITQTDFRGKDAIRVELPLRHPYTIVGFCVFANMSRTTLTEMENLHKKNVQEGPKSLESKDFLNTIARIKDICYTQKFNGAAVGIFKENIIARDLGLIDRQDHTTGGDKIERPPTELRIVEVTREKKEE